MVFFDKKERAKLLFSDNTFATFFVAGKQRKRRQRIGKER